MTKQELIEVAHELYKMDKTKDANDKRDYLTIAMIVQSIAEVVGEREAKAQ